MNGMRLGEIGQRPQQARIPRSFFCNPAVETSRALQRSIPFAPFTILSAQGVEYEIKSPEAIHFGLGIRVSQCTAKPEATTRWRFPRLS
jgi:hypothetical protein